MMLEAREARRGVGQSAAKSDLSDLETRKLKKIKVAPSKTSPSVSYPQVSTIPPLENSRPNSLKKMKTLISDEVCLADWEIPFLMHKANRSDQIKPSNEFKYWGNCFDGLKFLYDHLNATIDMNKLKTIGWNI